MRTYLLAAAIVVSMSSPAAARDGSAYGGIEGGLILDGQAELDLRAAVGDEEFELDDAVEIDFKRGADLDLIAGYDFGMVRAEAELGYKRLGARDIDFANDLIDNDDLDDALDAEGRATVWSLMGNALLDFGGNEGLGGYVGGGIGAARGKFQGESGTALAWQALAGLRLPISSTVDLGLKYRFFNSQKLKFSDSFDGGDLGIVDIDARGKLRTHSLLASLIFNFSVPAAQMPPPPPPAPPVTEPVAATQTCPDGSVILATTVCPPPPAPPQPVERGERGQ